MTLRHSFMNLFHAASLCLAIVVCGFSATIYGGEVGGLFEAEITVKNQGEAERNRALNTALIDVLIKVSGNSNVASMAALEPVLSNPLGLVQQFRYRALPKVENQPGQQTQGPEVTENPYNQILQVNFDPQAVNQALNNAGLPVWGRARPSTLLWLAVEDNNERYLVGGDSHPEIQKMIRDEAQRRGVPVLIPLLDLEDEANLRFTDVWGDFQDVIVDASNRYQAEAFLVGRLFRQSDGTWQGRWSLYSNNDNRHWDMTADQTRDVIVSGIDGAADYLSSKFSKIISEVESTSVELSITGIDSLGDYARAMKYLHSLDPVTQLQVEKVSSSTIVLLLGIRGDHTELVQAIGFGSTLAPVLPPEVDPAINNDQKDALTLAATTTLYYRLLQ